MVCRYFGGGGGSSGGQPAHAYTQIHTGARKMDLWGGNGHLAAMQPHTWRAMVAIGVLLTVHNFIMFAGSRDNFVPGPLT